MPPLFNVAVRSGTLRWRLPYAYVRVLTSSTRNGFVPAASARLARASSSIPLLSACQNSRSSPRCPPKHGHQTDLASIVSVGNSALGSPGLPRRPPPADSNSMLARLSVKPSVEEVTSCSVRSDESQVIASAVRRVPRHASLALRERDGRFLGQDVRVRPNETQCPSSPWRRSPRFPPFVR